MSSTQEKSDSLRCSFCGKTQREVKKLIAGAAVFICNECVDICVEILEYDQVQRNTPSEKRARYISRARRDIRAADLLIEQGYFRAAFELAQSGAYAALQALMPNSSHRITREALDQLIQLGMEHDEELRKLYQQEMRALSIPAEFEDMVDEAMARQAVESANKIVEFVVSAPKEN